MAVLLEQIGAELSVVRAKAWHCDWNETLPFCRTEMSSNDVGYEPNPDDDLLHDVLMKGLFRGIRPFPSHFAEQWIGALYGGCVSLREDEPTARGSITYSYDGTLQDRYATFVNVVAPWYGRADGVSFDPEHPHNERELFTRLVQRFGPRMAHCISPQVEISAILPPKEVISFPAQRVDFLLSFPNGKCLVIEPGDHDTESQVTLDQRRDEVFRKCGIETLRPRNADIQSSVLYDEVGRHLEKLGVMRFLMDGGSPETEDQRSVACLFLLPTLVVRLERLLGYFLLRQGLIHQPVLRIGIIERDLECAEVGIASFVDRLSRLSRLFGIKLAMPRMQVYVQCDSLERNIALEQIGVPVEVCQSFEGIDLDILLDVGIRCNALTRPVFSGAPHVGSVRQTFSHNRPVRFGYRARARPILCDAETNEVLESFVRDFFRKRALRPGQGAILRNVLSQRATIGLLPTSAGKSLCYQLAALLTPGVTIVVDPIVALMQDQVQGLVEQFGISRVLAWHAGAKLHDQNVAALLGENIIVFISPERLQRPQFRAAMHALNAADIFINYAVIDEAHCVSMWGHDFRPSYLTLERNFMEHCKFQGQPPVIVALTGTASQLVLIDLKRELNILDMTAIIRPETFNRPELNFNLVKCPSDAGPEVLGQVMMGIARRLNVQDLATDAHGIIFAYTPRELWGLFGRQVGTATESVRTVLQGDPRQVRYGMYTGSPPKENDVPLFSTEEWNIYKERTLAAFRRGDISMLFGNSAVSVGIDNERLNYIINYEMPQSMEGYYQQCGRAGRSGQRSECYLIFSDDAPATTQRWLSGEITKMPRREDDLGTVAFFHQSNFPGRLDDVRGAMAVFRWLFLNADERGLVEVPEYLSPGMSPAQAERTERYISYWLILGVLVDYEVSGVARNTVYYVRRHQIVEGFLQDRNETPLKIHLVDSLHRYLSRYRPTLRANVEMKLMAQSGENLSEKSIACLVDFIYSQVEYQRRESIRTMVSYCNEQDTSPERLRARVRAYFDSSEKFSDGLVKMSDSVVDFATVSALLDRVEGFDDAEHLYWETRRLLDVQFRPDWAAVNLFAIAYRERAAFSDMFIQLLDNLAVELSDLARTQELEAIGFMGKLLTSFSRLNSIFGGNESNVLLSRTMGRLYERYGLLFVGLIDQMGVTEQVREQMRLQVVNLQIKEIVNANYSRIIG